MVRLWCSLMVQLRYSLGAVEVRSGAVEVRTLVVWSRYARGAVKVCSPGFHTEGGVPWDIPPQGPVFPPPKNFISQCHNESN